MTQFEVIHIEAISLLSATYALRQFVYLLRLIHIHGASNTQSAPL